jgi:hypothetical protein
VEVLAVDVEQLGVLGGGERADQAEAELVGQRLVSLGVVALVVDQGQLGELLRCEPELFQARPDQRDRVRELARVVAVALIGLVAKRDVPVQGNTQR